MKSNFQKIAVLCTCTGLLCSCGQSDNKQEHHKEFIPITILHPTTIEFPRSYVADVQAIQFVEIKPKVEGFVQKIYVDEGQKVKKGQPLFQLSSDQYSETVKEAQANYKQAQAQYEMANYEAERIGRLVDKQILSKIRLDQANKEKEVAQMKVEQAKAQMHPAQKLHLSIYRFRDPPHHNRSMKPHQLRRPISIAGCCNSPQRRIYNCHGLHHNTC